MTTVRQLIGMLQGRDPDARVIVRGYEGGFSDVNQLLETPIALNVNTEWYYGKHGHPQNDDPPDEIAIHLSA